MLSASFGCTLPILCQLMHLDFFYNFSYYITYIILQHCSLSSHFSFVSCCLARTHHDIHILLISYLAYIFFNKRSCPVQVPTSKWVPAVGALYKTSVYYLLLLYCRAPWVDHCTRVLWQYIYWAKVQCFTLYL